MDRRPLLAGNWKMFKTADETADFFFEFVPLIEENAGRDVVICPPFPALAPAVMSCGRRVQIGAQNCHWESHGAFTGEVSAEMIRATGARYVIVGHSERRQYFHDSDDLVCKKAKAAVRAGLQPIVCVGELLEERESGRTEEVLARQFEGAIAPMEESEYGEVVIAYEPVWAIGTGKTATPEIAEEAHRFLRARCAERFGEEAAAKTRILYGGSVKPDNISGLMEQPNIDGGLVGGASLDPQSFAAICNY